MFTHLNNRKYKCIYLYIHILWINTNIKYTHQEPPWCLKPFTCCKKWHAFPSSSNQNGAPFAWKVPPMFQKWFDSFQDKNSSTAKRQRLFQKPFLFEDERTALSFFSEKISFPFFGCISLGFWFFVLISLCFWCVWYQLRSLMIARTSGGHCSRKCYRILNQPGCLVSKSSKSGCSLVIHLHPLKSRIHQHLNISTGTARDSYSSISTELPNLMHCLSLEKIVAKIVPRHWTIHLAKQLQLARLKTNWDIYWLVDIDKWTKCVHKKNDIFFDQTSQVAFFLRGLPQNRWFFLNSYPWVSSQRDSKRLRSWPNDFMIESSRLYFASSLGSLSCCNHLPTSYFS